MSTIFSASVADSSSPPRPDRVCNYCNKSGHWKAACPLLIHSYSYSFAAPVPHVIAPKVTRGVLGDVSSAELESYIPFIRTGTVSMLASDVRVPVTTFRDIGAFDSFIQTGVLPLTAESKTEDSVPIQ